MPGKRSRKTCSTRVMLVSLSVTNLIVLGFYHGVWAPRQGYFLDRVGKIKALADAVLPDFGEHLEVHIKDSLLCHTSEIHSHIIPQNNSINIAIGGGLTSKNVRNLTSATVDTLQFFSTLLPSFCRTASQGYHYHFYLGYDNNDGFFTNISNLEAFKKQMFTFCGFNCPKASNYSLNFVLCTHSKRPAWAQNDAMFEAYLDNMDYYYRLNDDTDMVSSGWTEAFINVLGNYHPTNIGVVGPKSKGGNVRILTYEFVHKTHVEIFGFYYPRVFTDWFGDTWVTKLYQPGRWMKLDTILLTHTGLLGRRYVVADIKVGKLLPGQLNDDLVTLERFITFRNLLENGSLPKVDESKVISMSLYGKDIKYTYGAIRNAQLARMIYPDWKLRFYVGKQNVTDKLSVPSRILKKLQTLGAEIAVVTGKKRPNPKYWRYLVADDKSVNEFLIRDTHARLSDREKSAVDNWLLSPEIFHTIKDHPKHAERPVIDGLWAAKRAQFVDLFGGTMQKILHREGDVLLDVIWPAVKNNALCHDSVSCAKQQECRPFPVSKRIQTRLGLQYVGQKYDAFMNPIGNDSVVLNTVPGPEKCVTG